MYDPAIIRAECERVLRQNWCEGSREYAGQHYDYAYTCPSIYHYYHQWLWDSCFTAIAWTHFDLSRARRELLSLIAPQREDGRIGHMIFWQKEPLDRSDYVRANVPSRTSLMTETI